MSLGCWISVGIFLLGAFLVETLGPVGATVLIGVVIVVLILIERAINPRHTYHPPVEWTPEIGRQNWLFEQQEKERIERERLAYELNLLEDERNRQRKKK